MALSTAAPAGTIISTRRGFSSAAMSAAGDSTPLTRFPAAGPETKARVLASVEVVASHGKAVPLGVQGEIPAHDAETHYAELVSHVRSSGGDIGRTDERAPHSTFWANRLRDVQWPATPGLKSRRYIPGGAAAATGDGTDLARRYSVSPARWTTRMPSCSRPSHSAMSIESGSR